MNFAARALVLYCSLCKMGIMLLRLREVREKERGLTLEGAAEKVPVDIATISRHEREKGVDLKDLKMYAKAYRCHVAEFFVGGRVLTDPEDQLISLFRKLSAHKQTLSISIISAMENEAPEAEEKSVNGRERLGPIRKVSAKGG